MPQHFQYVVANIEIYTRKQKLMSSRQNFDFEAELAKCKTADDLTGKNGLVQRLVGNMLEKLLQNEMDEYLGYEKHSPSGHHSGNSRNGKTKKTLRSNYGSVELEVPRDRNGDFEPIVVKKHQRTISSFDDKIISMYAKGMSTRDIQSHIQELYGTELSPTMISNITEKVMEIAIEWQARPLQAVYPIIFFDAIHYKVKENGKVVLKASYTCLGIDIEGKKDVLGIWIGEAEGAKFWLKVCTELQNRGVKDVFIACIDGLKGLSDAIKAIFPEVSIQLCIIHMIRNSIKYVPHNHSKEFMGDLKNIYRAPTQEVGYQNLEVLKTKWEAKYPLAVKPWIVHWENVKTFFEFPEPIRRLIYTTNAVESVHRQLRKVTKSKTVFPTEESLLKMLFLAIRDVSKKWTLPLREWKTIISYLLIAYGDRLRLT
jgi:putative transposase